MAATRWRSLPWLTALLGTTERCSVAESRAWEVFESILPWGDRRCGRELGRHLAYLVEDFISNIQQERNVAGGEV